MRRVFPLILIAILIGALFVVNQGMQKNASGSEDDDQQQAQPTKTAAKPSATPPGPADQPLPP